MQQNESGNMSIPETTQKPRTFTKIFASDSYKWG